MESLGSKHAYALRAVDGTQFDVNWTDDIVTIGPL